MADPFALENFFTNKSEWSFGFRRFATPSFPIDTSGGPPAKGGGLTCVETYAGRVWFGGAAYYVEDPDDRSPNLGSYIFFSQIVDSFNNIGKCYQENDPTSEAAPDLLASDGGAIKIPDMQRALKMVSLGRELVIFAENGIWEISGGETNFSATNFEVRKVANVAVSSVESIVEVEGALFFWAEEGIYLMSRDQISTRLAVENITDSTIQTWYVDIPREVKNNARGGFDPIGRTVRWLFGDEPIAPILEEEEVDLVQAIGLGYQSPYVQLYDWQAGSDTPVLRDEDYSEVNLWPVIAVAFSPDNNYLFIGGWTDGLGTNPAWYVYDGSSGEYVNKLDHPSGSPVTFLDNTPDIGCVCWSADSRYLGIGFFYDYRTVANTNFEVYDYNNPLNPIRLDPPDEIPGIGIYGADFHPSGNYIAVGSWYLTDGGDTVGHGEQLALYAFDGTNITKEPTIAELPGLEVGDVRWSPDGNYLAVASSSSEYLTLYSFSGGTLTKLSAPATPPPTAALSVSWSADSRYVAVTINQSPGFYVYDMDSGSPVKLDDPDFIADNPGQGNSLAWGGSTYLSVCIPEGTQNDVQERAWLYKLDGGALTFIGYQPDFPRASGSIPFADSPGTYSAFTTPA